jgi:hypothetical protein
MFQQTRQLYGKLKPPPNHFDAITIAFIKRTPHPAVYQDCCSILHIAEPANRYRRTIQCTRPVTSNIVPCLDSTLNQSKGTCGKRPKRSRYISQALCMECKHRSWPITCNHGPDLIALSWCFYAAIGNIFPPCTNRIDHGDIQNCRRENRGCSMVWKAAIIREVASPAL